MKIAITGSTKLAGTIASVLKVSPQTEIYTPRVEDIVTKDISFWGFEKLDALINCAHVDFEQVKILEMAYRAWKEDASKYIINISSRAHQPNISKGHLYASQKAALNHLSNNLTYNSEKKCRICTINLGLLNHELPSLSWDEVATAVKYLIELPQHIEVPEITLQHSANYQYVQSLK